MLKPTIAITVGDPSGIGPEIIKKAVSDKFVLKICRPIIIGTSVDFIPGKPSRKSNKSAITSLFKAIQFIKNKTADAIVTSPVPKSAFGRIGGHTEFFAKITGTKNIEMLMVADDIKVLLLTRHIPLKDVSREINIGKIVRSINIVNVFLKNNFGIRKPKIVVCGLNPHCGDDGLSGNEEKKTIIPAIKNLKKIGLDIIGPVNPEIAFIKKKYNLVVCMYHDQAMLPLKLLKPNKIVNVTIGLPFIRTSPGHGTAYDIAGKGIANPQPMIEAIKLACYLTKNKKQI